VVSVTLKISPKAKARSVIGIITMIIGLIVVIATIAFFGLNCLDKTWGKLLFTSGLLLLDGGFVLIVTDLVNFIFPPHPR